MSAERSLSAGQEPVDLLKPLTPAEINTLATDHAALCTADNLEQISVSGRVRLTAWAVTARVIGAAGYLLGNRVDA